MTECVYCKERVVHGGDHTVYDNEEFEMESNFSCNNCGVVYIVSYPKGWVNG